jgi:hypothetical protein
MFILALLRMILFETKRNYFILNVFIIYLASTSTTTCVDIDGYPCQSTSTFYTDGAYATGYCCVYDTYSGSTPYLCIQCTNSCITLKEIHSYNNLPSLQREKIIMNFTYQFVVSSTFLRFAFNCSLARFM